MFFGVEEELKYLRIISILFEAISGLHINWGKCFVYPVNEVPSVRYLLSLGGRVTLINRCAMPTYMMSLFPIPGNVIKKLDSKENFLRQENGEGEKRNII